jgi:hypothetical protein
VRLPAESVRSYIERLTDEDAETTGAVGT